MLDIPNVLSIRRMSAADINAEPYSINLNELITRKRLAPIISCVIGHKGTNNYTSLYGSLYGSTSPMMGDVTGIKMYAFEEPRYYIHYPFSGTAIAIIDTYKQLYIKQFEVYKLMLYTDILLQDITIIIFGVYFYI